MVARDYNIGRHFRRLTVLELLVLIGIVIVLIALLVPATRWDSVGDIQFPVRVFVFDAARGKPIANADVAMFWAPPLHNWKYLKEDRKQYDPKIQVSDDHRSVTGADGTVVISYEFRTTASNTRPAPRAHLPWAWVHVQAVGYGGVVVPVRHDYQPTATLREQKELVVPIGLMPVK